MYPLSRYPRPLTDHVLLLQHLTDTIRNLYPDCTSTPELKILTRDNAPGTRIHPRFWSRVVCGLRGSFYIELNPTADDDRSGAQIQLNINLVPPEDVFDCVVPCQLQLSVPVEMMLGQVAEEVKDMLTASYGPRKPFVAMLMSQPGQDPLCSLAGLGMGDGDRMAYWVVPGHSPA